MSTAVPKITMVCLTYSGEYMRWPSQVKPREGRKDNGRFCSRKCGGIAHRSGWEIHCQMCDTQFYRFRAEQERDDKVNQFCTRGCYHDWRRQNAMPSTYLKDGAVHIHRIVAERVLGRRLTADEVVHHIDLDKHNNDPSNLAVLPDQSHHARCHKGGMSNDELSKFSLQ